MVMDRPWPEPSTHCPATAAQLFHSLPQNVPKEQPEAISRAVHCSLPAEELFRGWLEMVEVRALTGRSRGSKARLDQPSECVCKPHLGSIAGLSARRARRRVAEATVRGRPCNEQHCIRAANPRAHCCHGASTAAAAVEGRIREKRQTCATPSLSLDGHDSDLKTKPFVIPEFYRHGAVYKRGPIILW